MLNRQEVFNTVYTKLREQGKRSIVRLKNMPPHCMYRGEGGTRRAIGHLIPDELYSEELEGQAIKTSYHTTKKVSIKEVLNKVFGELTELDIHFLSELQYAHDAWKDATLCTLNENFRRVTKEFSLEFNDA